MSPVSITPINKLNLRIKYNTLSQYAQRVIKSHVKSISFDMEKFFSEIDLNLVLQNEQKLNETGIKQIGKNVTEGIVFTHDRFDYHVFSSDGEFLNLNILKSDSNQVCKHFSINSKSNEYSYAGNFSGTNIEDELTEALELVDDKLYKAKKLCVPVKIQQPFLPGETTAEKLAKLNKVLHSTRKNTDLKISGYIGSKEEELIDLIVKKLRVTQELYKKISDCRTKYKVRSSYVNYLPQTVANKLGFKNIGPNGESVTLFCTSYRNDAYTAIIVTDVNGKESKFVISKDKKSVQKNLLSKCVESENSGYRIYLTPDYYTQKEIDESKLPEYLSCLDREMDLFIEHTQNWFKQKAERKLIRSNYDTATLERYKDLLDDIYSSFEKYRTKMRKYLRKTHKSRKFKLENNISTKLTSTAVKFDNITPEGYDLRLSFPKVKNDVATQLLVMRGDEIINSFYVLDNKLLRFNIKDLNFKFNHYDQNLYYYDNKYLQESNLNDYLLLLRDKLHNLNAKLDIIRKKQIKNRIKYHIKSPKEQ